MAVGWAPPPTVVSPPNCHSFFVVTVARQSYPRQALLRMPCHCNQRDLRTVGQRVMPYFPQATIVQSTTGWNRAAAHVPLQSIVNFALGMARVIGKFPLAELPLLLSLWMLLLFGKHLPLVQMHGSMYGGGGGQSMHPK